MISPGLDRAAVPTRLNVAEARALVERFKQKGLLSVKPVPMNTHGKPSAERSKPSKRKTWEDKVKDAKL